MPRSRIPAPPLSEAVIADIQAQKWNDREIAKKHDVSYYKVYYHRAFILGLPGVHSESRRVPKEEEYLTATMSVAELQKRWGLSRSGVYRVIERSGTKRVKPVPNQHKAL